MSELEGKPPGKVQAIGIMHLIGGLLNVVMSLFWLFYGVVSGALTFGVGLVFCCPAFILLPIGIMEIVSGAKHLSSNHAGLQAPRITGFAEIAAILGCGTISMIFGILTLVFLNDPEVEAYYQSKQLTG
jgi:hypothetical protein